MDLVLSSGLIMTLNDLIAVSGKNHIDLVSALNTLNLFYKQRPDWKTSRPNPNFDSGCLTVAYFGKKVW